MSGAALISVVIPNHNGGATIGECLKAALASDHENFEIVVVDDASGDGSPGIIKNYPVKLIELKEHAGVSAARNAGSRGAGGDILLFIDADCCLLPDALLLINASITDETPIVGGTYTPVPRDAENFFSSFQSVFVNYNETRGEPDYIAAHCLAVKKDVFEKSGGFIENSYMGVAAGVEDVELSHRLREAGYTLKMNPDILVRHIFNFNFYRSMKNAFKKSKIWTMYLLASRGILSDSGTASQGLKFNVICLFSSAILAIFFIYALPVVFAINILLNRGLVGAFYRANGLFFALRAAAYYFLVYPLAVGAGSLAGAWKYAVEMIIKKGHA